MTIGSVILAGFIGQIIMSVGANNSPYRTLPDYHCQDRGPVLFSPP